MPSPQEEERGSRDLIRIATLPCGAVVATHLIRCLLTFASVRRKKTAQAHFIRFFIVGLGCFFCSLLGKRKQKLPRLYLDFFKHPA